MTEFSREQLYAMMRAEQIDQAPPGTGYWIMSHDDWARIAKIRVPFGDSLVYFLLDESRLTHLFGRPILVYEADIPLQHCGRYLKWDGSCKCQHCYNYVPCPAPLRWQEEHSC
jgi:hypothetical protein